MKRELLPPIGAEIAEHVEAFFRDRGIDPERAQRQGDQVAELMLTLFSGQQIRFPSNPLRTKQTRDRNAEIRERFDGKNAPLLAHEFGLSRETIWRIVNSTS